MPLHKKIFFVLLLLLPTQLAMHFWPSWSYVIGRRIDYLSPTIYFTDLLILLIIIFSFKKSNIKIFFNPQSFFLTLFILFNILFSSLPYLTCYKWLKILEFFLLGFYIFKNINLKKDWELIIEVLSLGIIFESALAIFQFINQSSINGIFYWLGERNFTLSTPNIAKAALNGILILRPYATFPHPNVLGGYLAVLLPTILVTDFKPMKAKWLAIVLGTAALLLSFSRPAIFIGLAGILVSWLFEFYLTRKKMSPQSSLLPAIILAIIFGLILNFSSFQKESIERRLSLNETSLLMFLKNPIFGIGLGNFIPQLPLYSQDKEVIRFLQPAHNIFLLTLSETGIIGFFFFSTLIIFAIRKLTLKLKNLISIQLLTSLFAILFLGLFDHYFLTLQQTQLLFVLILALSAKMVP